MSRSVAIFGGEDDPQVRAVADALRPHGVDPLVLSLTPAEIGGWDWGTSHLRREDGTDLAEIDSVYVRGIPTAVPRRDDPVVPAAEVAEWEASIERGRRWHGVARSAQVHLETLGVDLVNPSPCFWYHRSKPAADLRVRSAGIRTPRSLVTSDPDAAASFLDRCDGEAIYKPVAGGGACRVLTHDRITDGADALRRAPVLLQERIAGRDLRIYTVDGEVAGGAVIHTDNVDYRGHETGLDAIDVDPEIADIARRAADALGMVFAGIDIKDPGTGVYTVLDVNPSPMFASLSDAVGLDVPGTLARRLAKGPAR